MTIFALLLLYFCCLQLSITAIALLVEMLKENNYDFPPIPS